MTILLCVIAALTVSVAWLCVRLQRAVLNSMNAQISDVRNCVFQVIKKLDNLSDGRMSPEERANLETELNKLMSYSMDDAMKAAKPVYGSDSE